MIKHQKLLVLCLASFAIGVTPRASKNPCHPALVKNEPGADCEQIALPVGFCSDCLMDKFNDAGEFIDCKRTSVLSETCIDAVAAYVESNPCDANRKEALETFHSLNENDEGYEDARLRLDWFVFSICEQGCDCIPQNHADRNNRVIDASRGNCQAHVHYHICKLMPGIKLLRLMDDDGLPHMNVTGLPTVCDTVRTWLRSTKGLWLDLPQTPIEPHVQTFIEKYIEAEQLFELDDHWNQCFNLELAQSRISEDSTDTTTTTVEPETDETTADRISSTIEPGTTTSGALSSTVETETTTAEKLAHIDVFSFSLIDVDTNATLIDMIDDYSEIPVIPGTHLSVRANVMTAAGSVRFDVNGKENIQTENVAPYAIAGDFSFVGYKPWEYTVGVQYEVTATAFSEPRLFGLEGEPLTVHFMII